MRTTRAGKRNKCNGKENGKVHAQWQQGKSSTKRNIARTNHTPKIIANHSRIQKLCPAAAGFRKTPVRKFVARCATHQPSQNKTQLLTRSHLSKKHSTNQLGMNKIRSHHYETKLETTVGIYLGIESETRVSERGEMDVVHPQ